MSSKLEIVAIGDNITDCFVDLGLMFPGGNAVNVAVQASRSGCKSAYVGAVGDDLRGQVLRHALASEGVDVGQLHTVSGSTAYALVRHDGGERRFVGLERGVSLLQPSEEDLVFASGATLVHTTYCSGLEEFLPRLGQHSRLSFDFDKHHDDDYAKEVIPHVWVAEFSAAGLDERESVHLLEWAHRLGAARALVTRAGEGALYFDGTSITRVAASSIEPVDTLGAGDAFIGRTLCGIARNEEPESFLRASVSAADEVCQSLGGFGHGSDWEPTLGEREGIDALPTHFDASSLARLSVVNKHDS
jgi:fructoselysine 6-kinase